MDVQQLFADISQSLADACDFIDNGDFTDAKMEISAANDLLSELKRRWAPSSDRVVVTAVNPRKFNPQPKPVKGKK